MRPISDDLRRAQALPGVAWAVSAQHQKRASFAGDRLVYDSGPTALWSDADRPYAVPGQPCDLQAAACPCAEAGYLLHVLRSDAAARVGVRRIDARFGVLPATAPVDVALLASPYAAGEAGTPGIARVGSQVRLLYADGARLYVCVSADDGRSWGAPVLFYDGTGVYVRYSNLSLCGDAAGRWVACYSAWTAAGQIKLRGAHDVGAGWVAWPVYPSEVAWEVAGVPGSGVVSLDSRVFVYLHGWNYGWSSLGVLAVTLAGGVFVAWGEAVATVDRAGVHGEIGYQRVRTGEGGGAFWLLLSEGLAGGQQYPALAALDGLPGSTLLEEPQIVTTLPLVSPAGEETLSLVAAGGWVYLLGAALYLALSDPSGARAWPLAVLGYTYTQRLGEGGVAVVRVARPNACYAGDVLALERTATATLADGTLLTGSDSRLLRVLEAWQTDTHDELVCLDGPGVLSRHVLRRQKVLRAGDRSRVDDVRSLIAWAGVDPDLIELPAAGVSSPGFVGRLGESSWTALARYLLDQPVVVRPGRHEGGGIATDHPAVSVVEAAADPYADTGVSANFVAFGVEGLNYAGVDHPLGRYRCRSLSERLLTVAVGMLAGVVGESEDWRAGLTGGYDGVRPRLSVRVGRGWGGVQLEAVVEAERRRRMVADVAVWLQCPAHVGLELYDLVAFRDDERFRVISIREVYERGRLEQEVELG